MIGWLVLGAYVVGIVWCTPWFARLFLNDMCGDGDSDRGDRLVCFLLGATVALAWPGAVPAYALYKGVSLNWLRTDAERRRALEREAARTREMAKRYNLPMGDEK